jgi:hypothetical protein
MAAADFASFGKMKIVQVVLMAAELISVAGCAAFYRKQPSFAGKLGIAVIALAGVSFAIEVIGFALTKEGVERIVLLCAAVLATPAVAFYWLEIWQKKRPDALS